MGNRRLFVALEPPEPVRRRLAALAAELRRAAGRAEADVRWVPPENVHLTLQFLGAVPEERVPDVVAAALRAAAAGAAAARARGDAAQAGSRTRAARASSGSASRATCAALARPRRRLGRRLAPLGFPPEARPYSRPPHARPRTGSARRARASAGRSPRRAQADGSAWRAAELVLFESHLSPKGPRYEAILRAPLGGAQG